jgi:hypothetical protein
VLDFKKIKDREAFKNIIAGHNFRLRNYPNRLNIDTSKTKNNIVLTPLKFKSEDELLRYAKKNLKKGKRQIKKNSAKSFSLVVDCSVRKGWGEDDYIEYLKTADKWLNDYFKNEYGLINLGSVIHMDESKPHLHISFSYFSQKEGAWIQKKLSQSKATDFNTLLKKFEAEVGQKYGLKRGDNKSTKIQLGIKAGKHFNDKFETYKVKKGLFATEEIKAINIKNTNEALKDFYSEIKKKVIKKIPEIGQIERLKEELIKKNKEIKKIKETAKEEIENKYKKQIWDLTKALNSDLSMELKQELDKKIEDIEKLQSIIKTKNNELNYKNKQLQEQQKKIRELTPKNKYKNKDFKGIGF